MDHERSKAKFTQINSAFDIETLLFYKKMENKKEKQIFSLAEVAVLIKFIKTHKEELFRKLLSSLAKQKKDNGAVGNVSPVRFARDTENKIYK